MQTICTNAAQNEAIESLKRVSRNTVGRDAQVEAESIKEIGFGAVIAEWKAYGPRAALQYAYLISAHGDVISQLTRIGRAA